MSRLILLFLLVLALPSYAEGSDYVALAKFEATQSVAYYGDAKAQFELGKMYENGLGTPQDKQKALDWFLKAAAQGHEQAKLKLEALE